METAKHHSTTLGMKGKIGRTPSSVKCLAFHEIYPQNRAVTPLFPQFGSYDQKQLKQPFKGILCCLHLIS